MEEFSTLIRPDGRFGAVFEADDDVAFFYLLDMSAAKGQQIISSVPVPQKSTGEPPATVRWSDDGDLAAVFRAGEIVAVFDLGCQPQPRPPEATDEMRFTGFDVE